MLDMTIALGREVPTTQQVLEVIRGELRAVRYSYLGMIAEMRADTLDHDEDLNLTDGQDGAAAEAIFSALRNSALRNVKDWAADVGLVFDEGKVKEFIRVALIHAQSQDCGQLPGGLAALDY